MKKLLTILILISFTTSFGVTPLKKGDVAPNDGFLFNKKEEKQLREKNERLKILEQMRFKQDELIQNQKKQIGILKRQKVVTGYMKYLYFIGGVLGTSISVYLAGRLK